MRIPFDDRRIWLLVGAGSAALVQLLVRNALHQGWKLWKDEEPPNNPANPEVDWKDALIWAGATGLAMGVGRVLARRGAAAGWHLVRGTRPPF